MSLVGTPQTEAPGRFAPNRPFVRGFLLPALVLVGALVVLMFLTMDAQATHYRYGTLSWEPTGNPNEVRFTGAQAWRASAFGNPSVGAVIAGESSILTGDGGSVQPYLKVVARNAVNDWFFAEFVDANGQPELRHTYAGANDNGQPWVASWSSCCRISPISSGNYHVNNPDQSELLQTFVDLATGNSSPKTNLPPINSCPINALCTIPVPFVDPDGDTLSFRLATVGEAGDPRYVPPGPAHATNAATIGPSDGVITWDTNGATYDAQYHTLYSMQVMLEDGLTKTPLDFFIELVPPGVEIPQWTPASNCGGSLTFDQGDLVQFTVTAFSDDAARTLTMDHLGLPPGATFSPGSPANPVSGTFTWSPTQANVGSHIVIFTAVDDLGYAAPSCPITLTVLPTPDATSNTLGYWIGHTVPFSAEVQSTGAEATGDASDQNIHHTVSVPTLQFYAEAVEERAATAKTTTTAGASGYSETGYVSLLGGLVQAWGLVNEADLTWNAATGAHTVGTSRDIARLVVNGQEIAVDDSLGSQTIPLPTGGSLVLFEASTATSASGVVHRSNLVHLYSAPGYSSTEVILGSLLLQAAKPLEAIAQERFVLTQDDAGCGCDAPGTTTGAVSIGPGIHHGSVPGRDGADVYAIDLAHGEKLVFLLDGAERELVAGGSAHLVEPTVPPSPTAPDVTPPTRTSSPSSDYRVTLFDPTGAQREFAEFALSQAPERLEMNADRNGTWHLKVARLSAADGSADNYTMAVTVTPVPLLPQADALVLGDAPGACTVGGLMPNVDTGLWPGVVRDDDFADFYHFEAEVSELITLVLKPGETADGVNMALSLWDRDCALLQYVDAFGAHGSGTKGAPEPVLELPSLYTGDYYIGIHRINGVGNHYLQLNVIDPMPGLPTNDGGTGGDAPADWQSGPVQTGPAFQGTLSEGDPGDGYRIPLEAGRRVVLTFEGSAVSQYDVRFYTPGGAEIAATTTLLGGQTVVYSFTPGVTGQYGLEMNAVVGGGDYLVTWAQLPLAV